MRVKSTAVVGGGAAGFFLAVNLKEMMPEMEVTIFESGQRVLRKVEVSGGGRCNCTNSFRGVSDLSQVYPRGHRLLKRLFHVFDYRDAFEWFERHGVPLVVQDDECVFPRAQDSHAIIDCFLSLARRYGVKIVTGQRIASLDELAEYEYVVVTTGGLPHTGGQTHAERASTGPTPTMGWLVATGHEIVEPVPSLFSFTVADDALRALQGLVVEDSTVFLPGTKLRAEGPLLITHWGLSGPAILKLSSYATRHLADCGYRSPLAINWLSKSEADVRTLLVETSARQPQKMLTTYNPFGLPQRLWTLLVPQPPKEGGVGLRWGELGKKDMNRLVNSLTNYSCQIEGRAPFKDEFVTCGGISLSSVNPITLESRSVPHLFFAGEVLDIDGITGGFNFQAAWTTAYTVAKGITALP